MDETETQTDDQQEPNGIDDLTDEQITTALERKRRANLDAALSEIQDVLDRRNVAIGWQETKSPGQISGHYLVIPRD